MTRRPSGFRRLRPPQRLHQLITGDDLAFARRQESEKHVLLRSNRREIDTVSLDFEHPEKPEVHLAAILTRCRHGILVARTTVLLRVAKQPAAEVELIEDGWRSRSPTTTPERLPTSGSPSCPTVKPQCKQLGALR